MMWVSAEEWQQSHGQAQEAAPKGVEVQLLRCKGGQPVEHDLIVAGDAKGGDRRVMNRDVIGVPITADRVESNDNLRADTAGGRRGHMRPPFSGRSSQRLWVEIVRRAGHS